MKWNKVKAVGLAAVLGMSILAGCGEKEESMSQGTVSSGPEAGETEEAPEVSAMTIVQVTAVDGNTVTADVGELKMRSKPEGEAPSGEMPEKPEGEAPSGEMPEKPDGEAPEAPSGEASSGEMPEKPEGEAPSGEMPEKPEGEAPTGERPEGDLPQAPANGAPAGGSPFEKSGESITFQVTDETKITVEFLQGEEAGTVDSIAVGSVLEVELDEDNLAKTIVVKNLNGVGGFGGSNEVTNGSAANTISEDGKVSDTTYTSAGDDENALRIDGAEAELSGITVEKSGGASSNTENGDFYGMNAGLLALNGAQVTLNEAQVNTEAVNGNGVFSYGEGTTVNISDSTIRTGGNNSGGLQTTGGGTMIANNLDVETQGSSAAAIRSDRGGGTVNVTGGTYVTNGTGSPAIYCTADIVAEDAELMANASEGVVVEGKNSVSLVNCDVTSRMSNTYNGDEDENIHGIMIYQSMSGDAQIGEAVFTAEGGSITAEAGDFFYVTNTDCNISLTDVACTLANDTFLRVEGNSSKRGWGTEGANGGDVVLTATKQEMSGNIIVDDISTLKLSLADGSTFTGAINTEGAGGAVELSLSDDSAWELTGDSYISAFSGNSANIVSNGYHLYVDGEEML